MDRFLKRNHWFLTLVWSFSKLDQFPESRALCMLWWRNWKVKKINLSHILSTSRHFFPEYVVQYYLYERKDDGDKIFVCNHTWFFSFVHGQVPCTSLFSFHFYGVRAQWATVYLEYEIPILAKIGDLLRELSIVCHLWLMA